MAGADSSSPKRFGDYLILGNLGRGGMGSVFKAQEPSLNRVVAIKLLERNLARDEVYVKRFLREARAMAGLSHPNIVTVHGAGKAEGRYYIAMEFVDGKTVSQAVRESGGLELDQALDITRQVADGLAQAHEKGIVHRDIKPQNIMLDASGHVKVMDFGLARGEDAQTQLTVDGSTLGTPRYMSPEQCEGKEVDRRTDIYSLGVSLYEMLTNRAAYTGDSSLALMYNITHRPFPDISEILSDLPRGVSELIRRMTAKDLESRYASAELVARDCAKLISGKSLAKKYADTPSAEDRPRLVAKMLRSRLLWAGLASAVVFGILFSRNLDSQPSIPEYEDGPYPRREVTFPEDYSVGAISTLDWGMMFGGSAPYLTEAQGLVDIPANQQLILGVNAEGGRDLSWLDELDITDIQGIGFSKANIRNEDVVHVGRLSALRMLRLSGLLITDAALEHIGHLRNMRQLNLTDAGVTDAGIAHIAGMTKMTRLHLDRTGITDRGMAHLQDMKAMEELYLVGTKVGDAGLAYISEMTSLRILQLNTLGHITDVGVAHLAGLTNLHTLDLTQYGRQEEKLTDAGLRHLDGMTQLKELRLAGTHVTDAGVEHISRFTQLEELHLNAVAGITDEALEHIANLEGLRRLNVHSDNITGDVFVALTRLPELKWLSVPPKSITPEGIASLKKMESLEVLSVAFGADLTLDSLQLLTELVGLERLQVQKAGLDDSAVPILKQMGHLESIILYYNSISPEAIADLRAALPGVNVQN